MELILRLKEFYLLEILQVEYYKAQVDSSLDSYIHNAYERMVEHEQEHANFFVQVLTQHNQNVPTITGGLARLAGYFLGEALDFTSPANRYKVGMALEWKAIEMHRAFILETWKYPDICKKLWHNMMDEEFHLLWFKDQMRHSPA